MVKKSPKKRKAIRKDIKKGKAYIKATFNNTIITITDEEGNTLFSGSAGSYGYKGTRKSTPYAAGIVAKALAEKAENAGMEELEIIVKGVGGGRESAIRSLGATGLKITKISDATPIPHNGCRPKKVRRV